MQKFWAVKDVNQQAKDNLSQQLSIDPVIAQLLINRDIVDPEEAKQFLLADLSTLHDPFLFKDMDRAVERIHQARDKGEKVLVFGDYDVDGVTSSALLNKVLLKIGVNVIHHIPHRFKDGYGLNHEIAEYAKEEDVKLLITVDCGISAHAEVDSINDMGIDVIIIDHHEPSEEGNPNAVAIVNPKQKDCPYPFKELASVGLAAKVTHALTGKVDEEMLDLTAIGTIADVVPLRGENRVFVKAGLPKVKGTKNLGLQALLELVKIKSKEVSPFHVGFILGPRINAAGRMDTALTSLDLFLSEDITEARRLAKKLDSHNQDRQKMQKDVIAEAMNIIEQEVNFKDQKVIVLNKEGWHKGVLGIVASRIADKYYRPAVVISTEDGVGTASCRSIAGFHLHEALTGCDALLENFGGHEAAAGLTIKEENIDPFRELINKVAHDILEVKKLTPTLNIDCEILLEDISIELANTVEALQPYGEGNPTPVFTTKNLTVKGYPQILGRETIKFWVTCGEHSISAVGFGMASFADIVKPGAQIDLAFELSIDDWNKAPQAQLRLKDIKLSS